jgi:antitoxin (DNA-binding transcriptional repressor) of toxin-antitoxin stability system
METINVVDAKSRFSELISRASSGERFLIRRRERDIAVLISPGELERLERTSEMARRLALALGQDKDLLQKVERCEVHPAMAAYGLWQDEADLANIAEEIASERTETSTRAETEL